MILINLYIFMTPILFFCLNRNNLKLLILDNSTMLFSLLASVTLLTTKYWRKNCCNNNNNNNNKSQVSSNKSNILHWFFILKCPWLSLVCIDVYELGCVKNTNLLFCYTIIYQQHYGYENGIFITFITLVFLFFWFKSYIFQSKIYIR